MSRWKSITAIVVAVALSACAGYWLGFREAWQLGVMADSLPRGVIASQQLTLLRAGKPDNVIVGLEFDVDHGLLWGGDVIDDPLTGLLAPVWGIGVEPYLKGYAARLAKYRKAHPSLMTTRGLDAGTAGDGERERIRRQVAIDINDQVVKLNARVEQYSNTP